MTKTLYDEALADIAAALGLVDKVSKLAYSEYGYNGTRRACGYVELLRRKTRLNVEMEVGPNRWRKA